MVIFGETTNFCVPCTKLVVSKKMVTRKHQRLIHESFKKVIPTQWSCHFRRVCRLMTISSTKMFPRFWTAMDFFSTCSPLPFGATSFPGHSELGLVYTMVLHRIPSWQSNISSPKACLKMMFLFPDMGYVCLKLQRYLLFDSLIKSGICSRPLE